eukprot:1157366-Pelagomonas_calceolata.AAC.10
MHNKHEPVTEGLLRQTTYTHAQHSGVAWRSGKAKERAAHYGSNSKCESSRILCMTPSWPYFAPSSFPTQQAAGSLLCGKLNAAWSAPYCTGKSMNSQSESSKVWGGAKGRVMREGAESAASRNSCGQSGHRGSAVQSSSCRLVTCLLGHAEHAGLPLSDGSAGLTD